MATAPIYSGDQQQINTIVVNGVMVPANATLLDAQTLPAGWADYVFSADFTLVYNGQTLSFRVGVTYPVDAALLAALNAAGAPIVAA